MKRTSIFDDKACSCGKNGVKQPVDYGAKVKTQYQWFRVEGKLSCPTCGDERHEPFADVYDLYGGVVFAAKWAKKLDPIEARRKKVFETFAAREAALKKIWGKSNEGISGDEISLTFPPNHPPSAIQAFRAAVAKNTPR